ncbi:MAG: hypothetical protein LBB27_01220 [Tannerellaceae bacterium]|nr:hypothetical protein [Tannerellaceae bacterium]
MTVKSEPATFAAIKDEDQSTGIMTTDDSRNLAGMEGAADIFPSDILPADAVTVDCEPTGIATADSENLPADAVVIDENVADGIAEIAGDDYIMLSDESSLLSESDTLDMSAPEWDSGMADDIIVIA